MPGNLEQGNRREGSEKGLTVLGSWEKRLVNDSQRRGHPCWVLEDEQEFAREEQSTESEQPCGRHESKRNNVVLYTQGIARSLGW